MRLVINCQSVRRIQLFLMSILLWCSYSTTVAQNIYEDSEGRFALELPKGWKLTSEKSNSVYRFKGDESAVSIILTYVNGTPSRESVFDDQVDMMKSMGYSAPPIGSVVDMIVNDCQARWAEYSFEMDVNDQIVQMYSYLGSIVNKDKGGIGFLSIIKQKDKEGIGEAIKYAFETLRFYDSPLSGVQNVVTENIDDNKPISETISTSMPFEHELLQLMLPSGWSPQPDEEDYIITVLEHEDFGMITILGVEGDELGESREIIGLRAHDALLSSIPSMHTVRNRWDITTNTGETLTLEELEGSISVSGQAFPYGAVIAAAKNEKRGLQFLALYSTDFKKEATEDILFILKSLK